MDHWVGLPVLLPRKGRVDTSVVSLSKKGKYRCDLRYRDRITSVSGLESRCLKNMGIDFRDIEWARTLGVWYKGGRDSVLEVERRGSLLSHLLCRERTITL